jgi:nucleoside-diphosphate-sugar epimerase
MRVFLAGATGVIGTPLVPQLLAAGHQVTAMTRSVLRAAQLEAVGANPLVCDVFDADGVRAAMADAAPEAVIHQLTSLPTRLDWSKPDLLDDNNRLRTEGTRTLLDAALGSGARRMVAQSIAFAYAPEGDRVKEEEAALFTDAPPPLGGAVRAVAEHERLVTGTTGIEGLVLRYGMLYGPGTYYDRRGFSAADVSAGRVPLIEGATGIYSWLNVEDAASAAVAALQRGAPGVYNVVDDEPAPQPEWLPVLAHALRADPPPGGECAAPTGSVRDVAARRVQRQGQARARMAAALRELARRLPRQPRVSADRARGRHKRSLSLQRARRLVRRTRSIHGHGEPLDQGEMTCPPPAIGSRTTCGARLPRTRASPIPPRSPWRRTAAR